MTLKRPAQPSPRRPWPPFPARQSAACLLVFGLAAANAGAAPAPPTPGSDTPKPAPTTTPATTTEKASDSAANPEPEPEATDGSFADTLEVRGRADDLIGLAGSAAEGFTGRVDLARRPIQRPGELVETTPGLIATQHSGGGKANQYFLRGFNLDHGTDFSLRVDGVPVNFPSHGHGQGYADLNFLIPELVASVHFRKGPYSAEHGDFSSAGGADFELVRSLDHGLLSLTGGNDDFARLVWADSRSLGTGELLAGLELFHQDGPWRRPDDYRGGKGHVRYAVGDGERGLTLSALGYDAEWLSTDQIPRRLVESGELDRFDLVDPGPRGATQRFSLATEGHRGRPDGGLDRWAAYVLAYDFQLFSNFTYFLEDPDNGDQFEQADQRTVLGFELSRQRSQTWGERLVEQAYGLQLRYDDINNGLFRTRDLQRWRTVREDEIRQLTGGPWAEATFHWTPRLRTRLGLRADLYRVEVDSSDLRNSGTADDWLLSPKIAVILRAGKNSELYFDLGWGHHSNDARGATLRVDPLTEEAADRVDPLVRSRGIDLGWRGAWGGWHGTLTLFALDLDSELVFVGDGGSTEASRPSRRVGLEWTNFYRVTPWLILDLDATYTDAQFRDDDPAGDRIPGAVERTVAAGLAIERDRWGASLRWRHFSGAPLIEDGSVEGGTTSLVNADLRFEASPTLSVRLEIFNLLDRDDSDIEYFYTSRLPNEEVGVDDVHFHPVEPRGARLTLTWRRKG